MVIGNAAFELDPNDYRLFLYIKDAVFGLDPDSSPGPNEYTSAFFSACWNIVGSDVIEGATQFFQDSY